jgi:hypothetical protein
MLKIQKRCLLFFFFSFQDHTILGVQLTCKGGLYLGKYSIRKKLKMHLVQNKRDGYKPSGHNEYQNRVYSVNRKDVKNDYVRLEQKFMK